MEDGAALLTFAFEKETEDRLYYRWIGMAQYEVSFEEFKRKLMPVEVDEQKTLDKIDSLMSSTNWVRSE